MSFLQKLFIKKLGGGGEGDQKWKKMKNYQRVKERTEQCFDCKVMLVQFRFIFFKEENVSLRNINQNIFDVQL
jgi:hypothetical protein